jgi:hypothetical protein
MTASPTSAPANGTNDDGRSPSEGYVFHSYGGEKYVQHAVASVKTLRRHDTDRPVALFCPDHHREMLERYGADRFFQHIETLPASHRSIVGFKHHLHRFKPFDRSLFVDADMIWCRDPDPLWTQLSAFPFTGTGLMRADHFFGGPKGAGVIIDILLRRRRSTLRHFGLTNLPRVQAGMIYAQDLDTTRAVCETAADFLSRSDETHFRSRLNEGRSEETCEWSIAMAMSQLELAVFPWLQGRNSPQLDYIDGLTTHDDEFRNVTCTFYTTPFIYNLRGIPSREVRDTLFAIANQLPSLGDRMEVTPFTIHFGWLHQKAPFQAFADRTWKHILDDRTTPRLKT